jgi:CCR4-NOT transcription complex subunit 1
VIAFLSRAVVLDRIVPPQEFYNSLETLSKLAQHGGPVIAEQIALFLDRVRPLIARGPADAVAAKTGPVDIHDRRFASQCYYFFDEWLALFIRQPALPEKLLLQFVAAFEREGMLKNQQTIEEFFRVVLPACIEGCLNRGASQSGQELRVEFVDSLAKFVVVLVKLLQAAPVHGVKNLTVLTSFLGLVSEQVYRDYETNKQLMNQKPYFRLFSALIQDLCYPESSLETIEVDILMALGRTFHNLQPARVPVFCFSWLQLVSHRMFMPAVLLTKNSRCLTFFQTLLVDLFKFLERFLRKPELPDSILLLYRGTLRVLLVLLHDFPEFLCEFHFSFCDVIPPSCIQMRNLILSAFPRNMRLPDPFLPNLKVDLLPEIKQDPKIRSDTTASLVYSGLNAEIDSYLRSRGSAPPSFFDDLIDRLYLPGKEAAIRGTVFNVPLINSLVLYVGVQGIRNVRQDLGGDASSAAMEIFQALATKLDEEGRSYFLNAIANQLRYPNNHTYYFSCILLFLFAEATSEIVREQITKYVHSRLSS